MSQHGLRSWSCSVVLTLGVWLSAAAANAQEPISPSVPGEHATDNTEYDRIVSAALEKYGAKDYEGALSLF
ncbi:MAG TPA: hypothetical protein VMF89_21550, partial [Polyangiales bacterium]|nr:hypothetical protein [Polyangiales bacterium]